jgi:2'-5' RNA ligase
MLPPYFINAFFAIMLDNDTANQLLHLAKKSLLNQNISWYPPQKLHLTLLYCNFANLNDLNEIKTKDYLINFTTNITTSNISVLNNQLVFLIQENHELSLVRKTVLKDISALKIPFDNKKFIPHITISYPIYQTNIANISKEKTIQIKSVEIFKSVNNTYLKI